MICESYYEAIRNATPQKIEALDMGRRGLHNEGSALLQRAAGRQGGDRPRHRPAALHPDLRPALAGLTARGRTVAASRRGAVRLQPQPRALAHGRGADEADASATRSMSTAAACRRDEDERARPVRRGGDGRARRRPEPPPRQDLRRPGRRRLRPGDLADARGAAPGGGAGPRPRRSRSSTGRPSTRPWSPARASSVLDAYRSVRDALEKRLRARFGKVRTFGG